MSEKSPSPTRHGSTATAGTLGLAASVSTTVFAAARGGRSLRKSI